MRLPTFKVTVLATLLIALGTTLAIAVDMNRIIGTQTMLIRLQATEYQRSVAIARARAYVDAQFKGTAQPHQTEKATANSKKTKPSAPQTAAQPKKKLPRYLAVETVKDKRTSPQVKNVIMIWDTQSESLVNNDLYDVKTPPPAGTVAKFETYSAEYIGAGH